MKSSLGFLKAHLMGTDSVLSLVFSMAGTPATSLWGIGGPQVPQVIFGQWYHCPCWPPNPQCIKTIPNTVTQERKNMINLKLKKNQLTQTFNQQLTVVIALAVTIMWNTGCSSVYHKKQSINDVLVGQSDLLSKLENERREPELQRKVQTDETLRKAEAHLQEAIQALRDSSHAIQSAL